MQIHSFLFYVLPLTLTFFQKNSNFHENKALINKNKQAIELIHNMIKFLI